MCGRPSCSPTSWMTTMFSCMQRAVVRASRRKRAPSSGPWVLSRLTATSRPRRRSRARYTSPMPPRPSSRMISYWPMACPGDSSVGAGRPGGMRATSAVGANAAWPRAGRVVRSRRVSASRAGSVSDEAGLSGAPARDIVKPSRGLLWPGCRERGSIGCSAAGSPPPGKPAASLPSQVVGQGPRHWPAWRTARDSGRLSGMRQYWDCRAGFRHVQWTCPAATGHRADRRMELVEACGEGRPGAWKGVERLRTSRGVRETRSRPRRPRPAAPRARAAGRRRSRSAHRMP